MNRSKLLFPGIFLLNFMIVGGALAAVPQSTQNANHEELTSIYRPTIKKSVYVHDLSIQQALNIIQDNYHVIFLHESGLLDGKTVKYEEALPNDPFMAIKAILSGYNLQVDRLNDHSFVIYPETAEKKVEASPVDAAIQQAISGKVTDASTGESLPGVNIIVPGTSIGTATDANGQYTLDAPESADSLMFSYIGYATQTVAINGRSTINITLSPTTLKSSQVVVVGYGTQRKKDLTGSISQVSGSDIAKIPTTDVNNALQGKLAGVQVTPNSGQPGASATVRIRGVGTLNNASPIYVVDGMITDDISYLNPDNIESMEVLKDASATAIYGSRGANGVIIITTKHGSRNQGAQYSFNAYYGWQEIQHKIGLANGEQYATLVNELNANEGRGPAFQNPSQFGNGTDWQNLVYNTAPMMNYDMSVNGGTTHMTYNVSGSYIKQKGIIDGSNYERMSLRVNNTYFLSDFVHIAHNISFTHSYQQDAANGVIGDAYRADPTKSAYDSNGDFSNITALAPVGNPLAAIYYLHNRHYADRLVGNVYADFNFLKSFEFKSSFGLDAWWKDNKNFTPQYIVSPIQQSQYSTLSVGNDQSRNWLWENTLHYRATYGESNITALAGVTFQGFKDETLTGSRNNIAANGYDPALWYLQAGDQTTAGNGNTAYDWSMLSYLFRVNYSLMDRYLLTATYRIDGSSRFGKNNQYGHFPSIAAGWRISEEPFMRDISFINNLKLRASWGKIGNDKISAYPGIPTITTNLNYPLGPGETLNSGATIVALANPNVRWEETDQTDIGLESDFLDSRLSFEVDYYNRKTKGILVEAPIPSYVGASNNPVVNAAEVTNKGFDFNAKWNDLIGDLSYNIGLVASTVHNEVNSIGQGRDAIFSGGTGEGGKLATRTAPGHPIGAFYGYNVIGVFQNQSQLDNNAQYGTEQPGDLMYQDLNGDGVITDQDRMYLGSPIPSFIFGANLGARYKGVDLSVSISGQTGNKIYNAKKTARFGTPNFETSYLNRWHGEGTSNWEPRVTNGGVDYLVSNRFLEDGSYLKIQNIQLGYTLPSRFMNQAYLKRVRIYVSGTNLVTFTKYSGYTPEIPSQSSVLSNSIDTGIYPVARTFTVGVNVDF